MSKPITSNPVLLAKILLDRLERISADSGWAHQASGVRASLAKVLSQEDPDLDQLSPMLDLGFLILENAAGEIPEGLQKEDGRCGIEKNKTDRKL